MKKTNTMLYPFQLNNMEKIFKVFIIIFVSFLILGVLYAILAPKPKMSFFDEQEMRSQIVKLNADLPREIGTIGYLDSIIYSDQTLYYIMTVKGDNEIEKIYLENYDDFREFLKYSVLMMNGQGEKGRIFAEMLDYKGLNIGVRIYTDNKRFTDWKISGAELKSFVDSCHLNPTASLCHVIDMQVKIANLSLPMKADDETSIQSVALNSIESGDDDFLLQSISYGGNRLILEYEVDEHEYDLQQISANSESQEYLENIATIASQDADIYELFGIMAISHSDIVIKCVGKTSKKVADISIPYVIIKRHCKVPFYMLS